MLLLTCSGEIHIILSTFDCFTSLSFVCDIYILILEHLFNWLLCFLLCFFYTLGMNLTQGAKSRTQKGHSLCFGYHKLNCTENGKWIENVTSKTSLVEEDIQTEQLIKLPIALVGL